MLIHDGWFCGDYAYDDYPEARVESVIALIRDCIKPVDEAKLAEGGNYCWQEDCHVLPASFVLDWVEEDLADEVEMEKNTDERWKSYHRDSQKHLREKAAFIRDALAKGLTKVVHLSAGDNHGHAIGGVAAGMDYGLRDARKQAGDLAFWSESQH